MDLVFTFLLFWLAPRYDTGTEWSVRGNQEEHEDATSEHQ
jgi:hypothetical protein